MKKLFIFLTILTLSANLTVYTFAEGELVVDLGNQIGTGGLSDGGWSSTLPGIGVAISLGLMAGGIDAKLTNNALEQGQTPTRYVMQQFTDWLNQTNLSYENVSKTFQDGMQIAADGVIYLGQSCIDIIQKFGNWIVSNAASNFIDSDYPVSGTQTATFGNMTTYYGNHCTQTLYYNGQSVIRIYTTSADTAWFLHTDIANQTVTLTMVSKQNHTAYVELNGRTTRLNTRYNNDYYWSYSAFGGVLQNIDPAILQLDVARKDLVDSLPQDFTVNQAQSVPDQYFDGSAAGWQSFVPGLSLPAGYTGAIDPGVLTGISDAITNIGNHVITIEDYIEALADAIDGTAANVIVYEDSTGVSIDIPVPDVIVPDPVYDPVQDPDVPDEVTYPYTPEIPASPENMMDQPLTLSLKDIFPFCIPFDIYDILSKFDVPAEAPRFNIDYTFPYVNVRWQYEVDFSPFNTAAAVLRTMELVAAIVGLALATRAIYIRS